MYERTQRTFWPLSSLASHSRGTLWTPPIATRTLSPSISGLLLVNLCECFYMWYHHCPHGDSPQTLTSHSDLSTEHRPQMSHCPKYLPLEISGAHQTQHIHNRILQAFTPTQLIDVNPMWKSWPQAWLCPPPPNPTTISPKSRAHPLNITQRNPLLSTYNITYDPRWSHHALSPWVKPGLSQQVSVNQEVDEAWDHTPAWARSPRESQPPPLNDTPALPRLSLRKVYKLHPFSALVNKCSCSFRVYEGNSETWLSSSFSVLLPLAKERIQYIINDKGLTVR